MKKQKLLVTIFIVIAIIFSFSAKAIATSPGENARQGANPNENEQNLEEPNGTEAGEPMPISENEGEPVNTSEDENEQTVDESQVHKGDLYVASDERTYEMDKYVDGNLFLFGDKVKITGAVNGSAFIFAQEIIIEEDAYIGAQAFMAGEKITINGAMADVYVAASKFELGPKAQIYRDVKVVAENASFSGNVHRSVDVMAKEAQIAEWMNVYGDFNYTATKEIEGLEEKATVMGETKFSKYQESTRSVESTVSQLIWGAIGTICFDVVMYVILLFVTPNFIKKAKDYVSTKGLLGVAIGLGFTILVPVIMLLLLMTGIGSGLSGLLMFIYFAVLMINAFITVVVANEYIANKLNFADDKLKKVGLIAIVSLAIWGLRKIPFIGGWISITVFLFGVGIAVLYQFDRNFKKS